VRVHGLLEEHISKFHCAVTTCHLLMLVSALLLASELLLASAVLRVHCCLQVHRLRRVVVCSRSLPGALAQVARLLAACTAPRPMPQLLQVTCTAAALQCVCSGRAHNVFLASKMACGGQRAVEQMGWQLMGCMRTVAGIFSLPSCFMQRRSPFTCVLDCTW
jgi:hypothetical protein